MEMAKHRYYRDETMNVWPTDSFISDSKSKILTVIGE